MSRDKVFISYSHADRAFMEEFKTMLGPVLRQGKVVLWDDTQIQPGARWREEIQAGLAAARVGVLLVSDNFLSSGFITNDEVPPLLKAAGDDGATVFWVCLSPCLWQHSPVAEYQSANEPDKPLDQMTKSKRKAVWQEVCQKLLQVLEPAPTPAPSPAPRPPVVPPLVKPRPVPPPQPPPEPVPVPQPPPFNPVGRWHVEALALIRNTSTVDLYPNGVCQGVQQIPYVGSVPFQGSWAYDLNNHTLTLQGATQFTPFFLVIAIQGVQGNLYTGVGLDGVRYHFTRLA
jgi:hypothetical protein